MRRRCFFMFKYELHMHTSEASACGKNTVDEMIRKYHSMGFAGAVLTNHFFFGNTCIDRTLPPEEFVRQFCEPYFEGQKTAKELDFDLLFGLEGNYGGGKEFLIYGITPDVLYKNLHLIGPEMNTHPYRPQLLEAWKKVTEKEGAVLALAHPFRDRAYVLEPDLLPDSDVYDAVEVFNSCNTEEANQKAADYFENGDKILFAGNDYHNTGFESFAAVAFDTRIHSEKALAEALKLGNFNIVLPKI